MRKNSDIRNRQDIITGFPIPANLLDVVRELWNKAGLRPDNYLDKHNDFCEKIPVLPDDYQKGIFSKKGIVGKYYIKAGEFLDEHANGGVHPTENRWLNPTEFKNVIQQFLNTIPYDQDAMKYVWFRRSALL